MNWPRIESLFNGLCEQRRSVNGSLLDDLTRYLSLCLPSGLLESSVFRSLHFSKSAAISLIGVISVLTNMDFHSVHCI